EVENANVRLEKSVLHANEMARKAETASMYKSRFLANVSHELRTPLNAVLGYAELLGDRITGEEEARYLAMISAGGNSLLTLISDILDLSRVEAGKLTLKPEPMDPRVMLHDVRRIFSKKISERGLDFIIEAAPSLPEGLVLDENRLRQVLINLVGNALKFTERGYIRIEARAAAKRASGAVDLLLSCRDTGVGVDADQQKRIFEAFQQPDGQSAKYGGAGLGLAISRGLLEMMNGEIGLESEPGKGSTFSIFLKNVAPAAPPERDKPGEAPLAVRFETASLMVVDDNETNRSLLKEMLEAYEFTIVEARNGKEALAAVKSAPPDLILMDMKMPVMDGYEAVRALKADEDFKAIPVIAVSASVMRNSEILVKEAGCDAFLTKPIRTRRLVSELMRHLPFTEVPCDSKDNHDAPGRTETPAQAPTREIAERLPDLLNLLETELAAELTEIRETLLVDEIREFGEKIEGLGRENELNVLTAWGENLYQRAGGFDVNGMTKALDAFPDLIRTIRHLMERIDG
ncbi:MAG: response regulator, partial [Desulfobacterales bacterium]|nr:response regulator [Desulfobacterales bacterium]